MKARFYPENILVFIKRKDRIIFIILLIFAVLPSTFKIFGKNLVLFGANITMNEIIVELFFKIKS